uniref:SAM domain-containing protein n=1 Tax=Nothobranchius furzeri TaxID=105023 RepID=A0A8C6M7E9_NOTFU
MDQLDSKRYSVDHGDSAFSAISSSYTPKSSNGFRALQHSSVSMCRQSSTSPNSFPDGNRTGEGSSESDITLKQSKNKTRSIPSGGYNVSPESQESKSPPNKDPTTWSVEDVVWFIRDADPQALGPHADVFRKHEIDGNALLLLKSDMIMKYLGLKLGPALKLCFHIDKLKQTKF